MTDLISRADVVKEFIKLFGCIQDVSDIDEWADICQTTVCEVPSAEAVQGEYIVPSGDVMFTSEVVRCEDCRHAGECHKSVQYTRNEPRTVTIGYSPIEWCSRGERKGGDTE